MVALTQTDRKVFKLFRECVLAVLNTGNDSDDATKLLANHKAFHIEVQLEPRGLILNIFNAPANAFVDGMIMQSIQDHIFSVLRDIIYAESVVYNNENLDSTSSEGITDCIFKILRHAKAIHSGEQPDLVVCWGGHSIDRIEYNYCKEVGYHLGLRNINIVTGCGAGVMKGPMKGARIGHSKQNNSHPRYVGISEPGILASEAPNPVVNELIIMPDIEKRLEAFVRLGHSILVFPGGAGTAEEVMYLLSILMQPENKGLPFTLIFTAPKEKANYFKALDKFIANTLGEQARKYYNIIVDDPELVSQKVKSGIDEVTQHRNTMQDLYGFNWNLHIPYELQNPFIPTHENMASLRLNKNLPAHDLACNLRSAFSGIVAGNVKAMGQALIADHGPYKIKGDTEVMNEIDELLKLFVEQGRMKIGGGYKPCYEILN